MSYDTLKIKNAKITSVQIGGWDGYLSPLTAWINLEFAGGGQGFGGFRLGGEYTHCFIEGVLKTLECDEWNKLVGMPCRIEASNAKAARIGHFLKDQWFDPTAEFAKIRDKDAPKNTDTSFTPEFVTKLRALAKSWGMDMQKYAHSSVGGEVLSDLYKRQNDLTSLIDEHAKVS